MRRRGLVSNLYRAARLANDVSVLTSGNPHRIARRAKNKIVGRAWPAPACGASSGVTERSRGPHDGSVVWSSATVTASRSSRWTADTLAERRLRRRAGPRSRRSQFGGPRRPADRRPSVRAAGGRRQARTASHATGTRRSRRRSFLRSAVRPRGRTGRGGHGSPRPGGQERGSGCRPSP